MARTWGGETTVGTGNSPAIAVLTDGTYVIVYDDGTSAARGQRFDADGTRIGFEFTLAGTRRPDIAALTGGGFVVTSEKIFSVTDSDPSYTLFNSNGVATTASTSVDSDIDLADQVRVARTISGGFAVVYHDPDLNGGDIELDIRTANGVLLGEVVANTITAGDQRYPDVAALSGGRIVATWHNPNTDDLRLRVFEANGAPVNGADVLVNTTSIAGSFFFVGPRVTPLTNGGFVVVFHEPDSIFPDPAYGVRARIFDSNGSAFGNDFVVNTNLQGDQAFPTITALSTGGFASFWYDTSGEFTIRGQIFDGIGNRIGTEFVVNTTHLSSSNFNGLAAAELADGRIVVSWQNGGIFSQVIDPRDGSVNGGSANDRLYGNDTLGDDIKAGQGNDILFGLKGNDQLFGSDGFDRIVGGGGDDLIVGGPNNDRLTGGSDAVTTWRFNGGANQFADFNGDGMIDILETSLDGQTSVWLSGGGALRDYSLWNSNLPQTVKLGDFNGDGKTDVIDLRANGQLAVGLSSGIAFGSPSNWGAGGTPSDKIGDFNGDGRDDIVQLFNGTAYVTLSNGAAFAGYNVWGTGFSANDRVADLNGDGKDDIIQIGANGNVYVALANAGGTAFGAFTQWTSGSRPIDQLADVDGNGRADLVELNENGNIYVWFSQGNTFSAPVIATGHGALPTDRFGDFNGDGKADIIELGANGNAYVWLSNGSGFNNYTQWTSGVRPQDQIGDINGDGKSDIIQLYEANGSAYVWISTGATFRPYQMFGGGTTVGDSAGDDTFTFTGSFGHDIITDFQPGAGVHDVIQLEASKWANFNDVMNHTVDDGKGNTEITLDASNSILLINVVKAQLAQDDFVFV